LAHKRSHLSSSNFVLSQLRVWGAWEILNDFFDASLWWKSKQAGSPLKPHIEHFAPL